MLKVALLIFLVLIGEMSAYAQTDTNPKKANVQDNEKKEEKKEGPFILNEDLEAQFIEGNIALSAYFDELADGLDTFIMGKRITRRRNETSVKVQNNTIVSFLLQIGRAHV